MVSSRSHHKGTMAAPRRYVGRTLGPLRGHRMGSIEGRWRRHGDSTDTPRTHHRRTADAPREHLRGTTQTPWRRDGITRGLPCARHAWRYHGGTTNVSCNNHGRTMEAPRRHHGRTMKQNYEETMGTRRKYHCTSMGTSVVSQWRFDGVPTLLPRSSGCAPVVRLSCFR